MAATPSYASIPVAAQVQISTANTLRDGTGTLGTLITGSANGTRVDDIYITAVGNSTAQVLRMFLSDGTNTRLLMEFLTSAVTASATVAVWSMYLPNLGIILPSGWSLKFSTNAAETYNICMTRGGDL